MQYDRQIIVAVGAGRKALDWADTAMTVTELYQRLSAPARGAETLDEYLHYPKTKQDALKDVGGFVGGSLGGGRRKARNLKGRDLITLDLDNIPGWGAPQVLETLHKLRIGFAAYSTRKHAPSAPRLRVVVPTDRMMTPDEYEPAARALALDIGIAYCDPTTFEPTRLMYWPSCSADSEFVFDSADEPFVRVDELLSLHYSDWRNVTEWPQVPGYNADAQLRKLAVKAGDPEAKPGAVGAFCRTYDVEAAMAAFLPGIYAPAGPGRYTYVDGSTAGGAVLYEGGKFLYSHHATDPCSGRLVNAFDLVRLHRFEDLDANAAADVPVAKLPSYKAMCDLAANDPGVTRALNAELAARVQTDFADVAADVNWLDRLERSANMEVKPTINNARLIMEHDPRLAGQFALNAFSNMPEVLGALPWEASERRRVWTDTDTNGLYWYMEAQWHISNRGNIDSALDVQMAAHAFNDVQTYINGLIWDGTPRLDRLLVDYLGAADTDYTRAVTRKAFVAAIARAMAPGTKFDYMLILCGPQGIGKSTLLDRMSRGWFNDSIRTFEGKEASELLKGVWLVEIAELDAFRRSDVACIKQFLSLRYDRYRAAYGRHVQELPRSCVFFGTCNNTDFLQDTTGNRRFWPVDVAGLGARGSKVADELTPEVVDQLWAEAKAYWQAGEELYLRGAVEDDARGRQEEHREVSARESVILDWLARQVPADWNKWTLDRRRDWWAGYAATREGTDLVDRDRVCALEVWCEALGGSIRDIKPGDTREINAILARADGWERIPSPMRFGPDYGLARGFKRCYKTEPEM